MYVEMDSTGHKEKHACYPLPTVRPMVDWRTADEIREGIPLWAGEKQVSALTDAIQQTLDELQKSVRDLKDEIQICNDTIAEWEQRRDDAVAMLAKLDPSTAEPPRRGRPKKGGTAQAASQ